MHHSSLKLTYFQLQTKACHQSPNLETVKFSGENLPNSSCEFLETQVSFLVKSSPLKYKCWRLLSSWVKIHEIPCVNFETSSQFLFIFFIILQCHYVYLPCKFVAHAFSTLDKRIPWRYQFWHFQLFWWKFAKLLMSFSKPQVSFSSNFTWLFSVMKILLCNFFRSNVVCFAQKGPIKMQIF